MQVYDELYKKYEGISINTNKATNTTTRHFLFNQTLLKLKCTLQFHTLLNVMCLKPWKEEEHKGLKIVDSSFPRIWLLMSMEQHGDTVSAGNKTVKCFSNHLRPVGFFLRLSYYFFLSTQGDKCGKVKMWVEKQKCSAGFKLRWWNEKHLKQTPKEKR